MSDRRPGRGGSGRAAGRPASLRLRGERGIAFMPELIVAVLVTMVTATALVKNIWQAHESELAAYRRARVLEELQTEMEYWKAQAFINGANVPSPNSRHTVPIDTGHRGKRKWILATFDPAPSLRLIHQMGMDCVEITVTASWPEHGKVLRESLRTAINQVR